MTSPRVVGLGLLLLVCALLSCATTAGATHDKKAKKPRVSIADVSVTETDADGVVAVLTVTMRRGNGKKVTVKWATADGTATAPDDYTAARGKLVFKGPKKKQTKRIRIKIAGDTLAEPDEAFSVRLTKVKNAKVKRAAGTATIRTDDARRTLTAGIAGTGTGRVTSSPAGLSCPGGCELTARQGTAVTLTATANPGSVFEYWSGACSGPSATCQVAMNGDRTVVARFKTAQLDHTLAPSSGSRALTSGFSPDPSTAVVAGGGPVNVAYLGGNCTGFTASAPTFRLNYTKGAANLLRFYFIGGSDPDPVIVVNDTFGNYYCNDDSFGTIYPTRDFNNPPSGTYDVWIGTAASGATANGLLYITGNSGNHP